MYLHAMLPKKVDLWVGGFDELAPMSAIENPPTHKGSDYRVRSFTNWHALPKNRRPAPSRLQDAGSFRVQAERTVPTGGRGVVELGHLSQQELLGAIVIGDGVETFDRFGPPPGDDQIDGGSVIDNAFNM